MTQLLKSFVSNQKMTRFLYPKYATNAFAAGALPQAPLGGAYGAPQTL